MTSRSYTIRYNETVRYNETQACDGVFSILIQWSESVIPVNSMQDQGLRLRTLHLRHPDHARIRSALMAIGLDYHVDLDAGDASQKTVVSSGDYQFQL